MLDWEIVAERLDGTLLVTAEKHGGKLPADKHGLDARRPAIRDCLDALVSEGLLKVRSETKAHFTGE